MPPDTIQRFEFAHAQGEFGWLLYLFLAAAIVLGSIQGGPPPDEAMMGLVRKRLG